MSNNNNAGILGDDDASSVESIDFINKEPNESIQALAKELRQAEMGDFMKKNSNRSNYSADISEMTNEHKKRVGGSTAIRISSLPESIRETAMELDKNKDGDLSLEELAFAIDDLEKKRKSNKNLKRAVLGFLVLAVTLIVCIFAASITAARLSKDFNVSPNTGMALVKGTETPTVMKTHSALERKKGVSMVDLSNDELGNLREVILNDGDLRLVVKGYSRDAFDEDKKVIVLIEGGTITYDAEGIVRATGNAKLALETIYGPGALDENNGEGGGRRRLDSGKWDDKLLVPPPPPPPPPAETDAPTGAPTPEPTGAPTAAPTAEPTAAPTAKPTAAPTPEPTAEPTAAPTAAP